MMDIERFAELRARMENGLGRDEVLASADLSVAQWVAMQRRCLRALTSEAKRGESTLATRYRQAFSAHGLAPQAPSLAPAPIPAVPIAPVVASAAPAIAAVPAVVSAATEGHDVQRSGRHTSSMAAVPEPRATPFSGSALTPPPPAADDVAREAELLRGETGFVAALTDEELGLAPDPASAAEPRSVLDETAAMTALADDEVDVLPFAASEAILPPPAADVAREAQDLMGQTTSVDALVVDDADLPFAPAPPELTLVQYACLVAELYMERSTRDETLARYGLAGADMLERLEAIWTARFVADPAAYGAFRAAFDRYTGWLRQQ